MRSVTLCYLLLGLLVLLAVAPAGGQQLPTEGRVTAGLAVFQQRCANCHGALGQGDGELAAQAVNPPTPLAAPGYLSDAVPAEMFDVIANGRMTRGMPPFGSASSNPLDDQQIWDVIAAIYAVGSRADALTAAAEAADAALLERLAAVDWNNSSNRAVLDSVAATDFDLVNYGRLRYGSQYFVDGGSIAGTLQNGTSGLPVAGGEVSLAAFEEFEPIASWATEVGADGSFRFDLDVVPGDWILRLQSTYGGLDYNSEFVVLSPSEPAASVDLTVFEASSDSAILTLEQLHLIVEVGAADLLISEFYAYSNSSRQAYVGDVPFVLPPLAEEASFSRLTASGQFTAATDVSAPAAAGEAYRSTRPLYPGRAALGMLVRYRLPYDGSLDLTHALPYAPVQATLIAPDNVTIAGWQRQGVETIEGQAMANYSATLGDVVEVTISGFPELVVDPVSGNAVRRRNEQRELIVGSSALFAAALAAAYFVRQWQQQNAPDPTPLLQQIADLDDAFAANRIKRDAYEKRRARLLQQVRDRWQA